MKTLKAAALLLVLSAPFWDLGHPLWEVDDARYAEIPREMLASGNWLVPSLNELPYIEKPPLIYWLGTASYRLFGVSEAAARLPLALEALAALAGIWWLASWLYAPSAAATGVLVLGSAILFLALSHMITPDMAVTAALTWAVALSLRTLRRPADASWAAPGAWLAMAAAFLSKGLIGIILPAAWLMSLGLLFPDLRLGLKRLLLSWGLPLACVLAGVWLWRMEAAVPGFWRVFFIEQHFQRFVDVGKYNRPGGWWFFLATDAGGFMPWAPAALAGLALPLARFRRADPRDLQLALWPAVVILFFTSSSSKLITYILPALPIQALLAARIIEEGAIADWLNRAALGLGAILLAAAPAAYAFLPGRVPGLDAGGAAAAGIGLAALGAATALASRGTRAVPAAALAALLSLACGLAAARRAEALVSARLVSQDLTERIAAAGPGAHIRLVAYDRYLHGIPFYTRRPVDVVNWVGELHYARRFAEFSQRFGDDNQISAWPAPGERVFVVMPSHQLGWVTRRRGGPKTITGVLAHGPFVVLELLRARSARPPSGAGRAPVP